MSSPSRLTFVHNPSDTASILNPRSKAALLAQLVSSRSLDRVSADRLLRVLGLGEAPSADEQGEQVAITSEDTLRDLMEDVPSPATLASYARACQFLVRELGIKPGEQVLVVNGRVSETSCMNEGFCTDNGEAHRPYSARRLRRS